MVNFTQLKSIIDLNSYTKNKQGVDQNGAMFRSWMEQLGYCTEVFVRENIGNHLHFRSAYNPKLPRVLLLGHLDTVFPPKTFEGFREDAEWVYGPGVCDMKGGNIVALEALKAVKQTRGTIANIDMLLVSDEESGSDDSKYLSAELAKEYDICLVFEAAGPDHEVVIERKGVGTFTISLEGKAAHAGNHYAQGCNANLAAAHMIIALTELTDLTQGSTVNAGKFSGGIGANTISPKASIVVEVRYTQTKERDRLLTALKEIVATPKVRGVSAELEGGIQRDVMQASAKQAALLSSIAEILDYPLKTEKRGGVSDANIVSSVGVATLDGFGPFGDGDHTIHERANKQSFVRRIGEVTQILLAFNAEVSA
ncbi:M20 family metallopeptidase [Agarivorans sp. TSD2052]|uniref:M20 family metallopeptidase n=1 Tax=Agarivorans sp. TSD2052 TaxID=2937286 RepID=UPI00200D1078|nr:M20 family metallopeptidase [Agarivorans sp. TSD2052]UPW20399.1 M20 family metallopeptidase [Agarivorans sp. TSD2052]